MKSQLLKKIKDSIYNTAWYDAENDIIFLTNMKPDGIFLISPYVIVLGEV